MSENYTTQYRDPDLTRRLVAEIRNHASRPMRFMEVCGTHTVSIFRHGIRSLLPPEVTLLSGPGCPVCVTAQADIDAFIAISRLPDTTVATFGDLMRVPGSGSSLQAERAEGRDIRVVYSALDSLAIARENPRRRVVFLGVGFETTAPTVAATLLSAKTEGLKNFFIYSAHKTVPPALMALVGQECVKIDGFLLPGHVSVIIGLRSYESFFNHYPTPCVVAGFEPVDILEAIQRLARQVAFDEKRIENSYPRAVTWQGNTKAQALLDQVFMASDVKWRGLGEIPGSGLSFRPEFAEFDAVKALSLTVFDAPEPKGCACGEVLTGRKIPPQCQLYKKICTPLEPVGPCMVSTEGTCAAYYRYHMAS
jgi:hydrogenase expression/formation protein HypD